MTAAAFQSPLKMAGGGEVQRCFYPLRLDVYGKGCANDCSYCYARSTLSFRNLWNPSAPAEADLDALARRIDMAMAGRGGDAAARAIRARVPVRLGGMTDCFQGLLGRAVVTMLNARDYPYLILTKRRFVLDADLRPDLAYVQVSVTTPYENVARRLEPGASSTRARLAVVRELGRAGIPSAVRINPLFPTHAEGHYSHTRIVDGSRSLRVFDWSLLDMVNETSPRVVIAGFLRVSPWNVRWIKDAIGEDIRWMFASQRYSNGALHFGSEEKAYYYERIRASVARFSVCYDGDDAFEKFRYLWANAKDCCDGPWDDQSQVPAGRALTPVPGET